MQARVGPSSFIFKFGMPTSTHLSSESWCLRELQFPLVFQMYSHVCLFLLSAMFSLLDVPCILYSTCQLAAAGLEPVTFHFKDETAEASLSTTLRDPTQVIHTTIITLYYPCTNIGTYTVYSQQLEKIRATMPKYTGTATDLYNEDLEAFIKEQTESNNQVILMGDFNQDMNKNNQITMMLKKYNIHDAIQQRHGRMTTTYEYGTNPIDSILCLDTITIQTGGHLPGTAISDHKIVWIEIHEEDILGITKPVIRPSQRKLQADHPRIRKKYNQILEKQLRAHNAGKIAKQLQKETKNGERDKYIKTYEKLDEIRRRATTHAENTCMKEKKDKSPFPQ